MKRKKPTESSAQPHTVTLADIADACGVTKATVSLALGNHPRISQATAERVRTAAVRLGYDPARTSVARRMAADRHQQTPQTRIVAIAIPGLISQGPFFAEVLRGLLDGLRSAGRAALILPLDAHGRALSDAATEPLRRGDADATVLMGPHAAIDQLLQVPGCADRRRVTVLHRRPNVPYVWSDEGAGAKALALHLAGLGHRRFLMSTLASGDDGRDGLRFAGFRAGLSAAGIDPRRAITTMPIPSGWLVPDSPEGDHGIDEPRDDGRVLLTMLERLRDVTAYVALNDSDGYHAWNTLTEAGIPVPGRISITGFDGTMAASPGHLTTVALPLFAIGRRAAKCVLATDLDAGDLLATSLRVGDSTGPALSR